MAREFNELEKLSKVYKPSPKTLIYCADENVIGSEFYLMERRRGLTIRAVNCQKHLRHARFNRRNLLSGGFVTNFIHQSHGFKTNKRDCSISIFDSALYFLIMLCLTFGLPNARHDLALSFIKSSARSSRADLWLVYGIAAAFEPALRVLFGYHQQCFAQGFF